MLTIWGRANSLNVQKVLWCCEEIGIAYQRIDAGGAFGVVDTPDYRKLNPNGRVPTIEDDGFVLWESHAISRYLAAKHSSGKLWPGDPRVRALADQWMDWSGTAFGPAFTPVFLGLVRTPADKRDPAAIDAALRHSAVLLAIVDRHLERRAFLTGDDFTVADIALGCGVWRWMQLAPERPAMPALERWFEALTQRPAYRKVVMHPLT
jgi:glutathione S-transferase